MDSRDMITFELFVHDSRYSVPTLHLMSLGEEGLARAAAQALLQASPHHLGVELWRSGEQLAALGACAERRPTRLSGETARAAAEG